MIIKDLTINTFACIILSCFECKFERLGADDMILSSESVTTVRDPRKARVQSPDMQRCGEEGGAGGGRGR